MIRSLIVRCLVKNDNIYIMNRKINCQKIGNRRSTIGKMTIKDQKLTIKESNIIKFGAPYITIIVPCHFQPINANESWPRVCIVYQCMHVGSMWRCTRWSWIALKMCDLYLGTWKPHWPLTPFWNNLSFLNMCELMRCSLIQQRLPLTCIWISNWVYFQLISNAEFDEGTNSVESLWPQTWHTIYLCCLYLVS